MAYYTPTWARRLVKEDHENIRKFVSNSKKDFRDYIDSVTPFVLWLDIGLIRERIISKSTDLIKELAEVVSNERDTTQILTDLIDQAYVATINAFINNKAYKKINYSDLEKLLSSLSNAPLGKVKLTIQNNFSRTVIVNETSKLNRSVMLIFPKFTTVDVGSVYKKELEKLVRKTKLLQDAKETPAVTGMFAQLGALGKADSEKTRFLDFINSNFAKLQNIGHIEVDVVSRQEKVVKRGQNSPRLLQALVSLPTNDPKAFQKLQIKFSKETGQASTRLKIRKKFTSSKLIFELLIEHGISVGIPETQQDNLYKAKLERAFSIGRGFTNTIRNNPNILSELETSKTIRQFINDNFFHVIKTGKTDKKYNSFTNINQITPIAISKVTLGNVNKKAANTGKLKNTGKRKKAITAEALPEQINLVSLQNLINSLLHQQIRQNMGTGDRRDVLNYRTGRFAESARVEQLTQGRTGMITAYYTYMKYPYATFSAGGEQEFPRSRDPKLLISQSIREIAQQQMITRMRAQLI